MNLLSNKKTTIISLVIFIGALLIATIIVIYPDQNRYLPCALMLIEEKHWSEYTEKELLCIQKREDRRYELLREKGIEESKDWSTYSNEKLGIAFEYPEYSDGTKVVFIEAGNIVFVTTTSSPLYNRKDELPNGDGVDILKKAQEISHIEVEGGDTFSSIDEYLETFFSGLVGWAIWVRDVDSDADLEQFIQDRFGRGFEGGCTLGDKFEGIQAGVYDVSIDPVRGGERHKYDPDSSCFINWILYFKYSPQHSRAAMWDVGQEAKFHFSTVDEADCNFRYYCSADYLMAESFRFIERKAD
ncbi:hypothetical protein L0Y40_00430 [Candidatus Wolfebacteria bacterium]|nr:hypothetical protein [Candidatus Wolfebacteria bacterium]